MVLWVPPKKHCRFYELMLMIDAAEEVNTQMLSQARHHPKMPEAIVRLIQNEFNESCRKVFTSELPVRWMYLMLLTRMITPGHLCLDSVSMQGSLQDEVTIQPIHKREGALQLEDGGNKARMPNSKRQCKETVEIPYPMP